MNFATYNDFRVTVQQLIDGDDGTTSDISPATVDLIVGLGEVRVYRELRATTMEAPLSLTVTSNAATLPTDCIALSIVWFDPEKPLEVVSESDLRSRSRFMGGGDVRKCAQAGQAVIFSPTATDGSVLAGRYYQRPVDIKTALNSTFTRYPELFVYAALCESAPFLGEEPRMGMWESIYGRLMGSAMAQENHRVYSGSQLRQVCR